MKDASGCLLPMGGRRGSVAARRWPGPAPPLGGSQCHASPAPVVIGVHLRHLPLSTLQPLQERRIAGEYGWGPLVVILDHERRKGPSQDTTIVLMLGAHEAPHRTGGLGCVW